MSDTKQKKPPRIIDIEELYTVEDVAAWLDIKVGTLYSNNHERRYLEGKVPVPIKVGSRTMYTKKSLTRFIERQEKKALDV